MFDLDLVTDYKIDALSFSEREDMGVRFFEPVRFIGEGENQKLVVRENECDGTTSFKVVPLDALEMHADSRRWEVSFRSRSFTLDIDDYHEYRGVEPIANFGNSYLCIEHVYEKSTGYEIQQNTCFQIVNPETNRVSKGYQIDSPSTALLAPNFIAFENESVLQVENHPTGSTSLYDIFGIEPDSNEQTFYSAWLGEEAQIALVACRFPEGDIDRRIFIKVQLGESPLNLEHFYPLDAGFYSSLMNSKGEIFWGAEGQSGEFIPTFWSDKGISQPLETPKQFSDLVPTLIGISKIDPLYGAKRLVAFFEDAENCLPIVWDVHPSQLGEVPKIKPSSITLNDGSSIQEIHDISAEGGLLIATILPFGATYPKRCILAPEIKF